MVIIRFGQTQEGKHPRVGFANLNSSSNDFWAVLNFLLKKKWYIVYIVKLGEPEHNGRDNYVACDQPF